MPGRSHDDHNNYKHQLLHCRAAVRSLGGAAVSHWYLDGELVPECTPGAYPSATTILAVRANPSVQAWRDRVGALQADVHTKARQDVGTLTHQAIESFLLGRKETQLSRNVDAEEVFTLVSGFLAWYEKVKPEKCAPEQFLKSDLHEFAGTADLVCQIDGEPWIVDFKTSKHIHPEYGLQLAAYAEAYREQTGIRVRRAVLQLTDQIKRGYRWQEFSDEDDFGVFMAHKEIFDWLVKTAPKKRQQTSYEQIMFEMLGDER